MKMKMKTEILKEVLQDPSLNLCFVLLLIIAYQYIPIEAEVCVAIMYALF